MLKRSKLRSVDRSSNSRPRVQDKSQQNFQYETLEPRQMLATIGSDPGMLVEYDLLTGTETYYELPESFSGLDQGGMPGFVAETMPGMYEAPGAGLGDPSESVFGNDDRVLVPDPHLDPHQDYGALRMQFSDGTWSFCSGTMVGPYHFLTAGHCVHDGEWIDQGTVSMGRDGDDRWWGAANVTNMVSFTGWTQNADPNFDWALIRLDRQVGNNVGWNGWWWWSSGSNLTGLDVSIDGYPSDLAGAWSQSLISDDEHVIWMYESNGSLLSPTTNQLRYNGTLDTFGGMSGSGVVEDRSGTGRLVVGIHAYGDGGNGTNEATRMTEAISDVINDRRSGGWTTPTDLADLTDWDAWFNQKSGDSQVSFMNSSSVRPGDSFSVTTYPRNNGTLTAGAYDVSFYLSTNTTISTGDTLLGTVSMGSLGEFAWDTATLNTTIPDTIASGNYYVGWIIDSGGDVSEFLEGNNTNYITASQLTVNNPLPLSMTTAQAEGRAFFINQTTAYTNAASTDAQSFNAFINTTTDIDSYAFTVDLSGTYEFRGGDFGNVTNPVIAVYDGTTGLKLGFDNDGGVGDDSLLSLPLSSWTEYVVAIADFGQANTGDVSIDIIAPNIWGSGTIGLDTAGEGSTTGLIDVNEDTDFYSFVTPWTVDTTGTVTVTPTSGTLDALITIWDGDGNMINYRDLAGIGGSESYALSGLTPNTTYRIGVQSSDFGSSGNFSVEVDLDIAEPTGIDFGPAGQPVWPTYEPVSGDVYSAVNGYGWTASTGFSSFETLRGNDLIRDKVGMRTGTFVIDVDNGTYDVDVYLGVIKKSDAIQITVEGQVDTFTPAPGPAVVRSFVANVTDGQLTFDFDGLAGLNNRINISGIGFTELAPRPISTPINPLTVLPRKGFANFWTDLDSRLVTGQKDPHTDGTIQPIELVSSAGDFGLQGSVVVRGPLDQPVDDQIRVDVVSVDELVDIAEELVA